MKNLLIISPFVIGAVLAAFVAVASALSYPARGEALTLVAASGASLLPAILVGWLLGRWLKRRGTEAGQRRIFVAAALAVVPSIVAGSAVSLGDRGASDLLATARALLGAKPPATKPPATKPPATKPPATKPPATKPPATKPAAARAPLPRPPARHTIPFKITSRTWDKGREASIPTSPALIDKLKLAFALWASVPEAGLRFEYAGLAAPSYDSFEAVPKDGTIYVVLDTKAPFQNRLEAGAGGYRGQLPGKLEKGAVLINTRASYAGLMFDTLVHEIGHVLGLRHVPTTGAVMSCGTKAWTGDVLAFSEQDRAELLRVWNRAAIYTVAGKVSTAGRGFVYVFAVDARNGRTYSTVSNKDGAFEIAVLRPGRYRLFAKGYESSAFDKPVDQRPSWYVAQGKSTADPQAGKLLELSAGHRAITGLELPMIDQRAPFNLFWSATYPIHGNKGYFPSFLPPERPVRFSITQTGGELTRVEPYGSDPDYRFGELKQEPNWSGYRVTVTADADAEPGHRLVIARGPGGVQAGLVGVHVGGAVRPSRAAGSIADQLAGKVDLSGLDPDYWRR